MTNLLIGGAYQGKRALAAHLFAVPCWADGADCTPDTLLHADGVNRLHLLVRRRLEAGQGTDGLLEVLLGKTVVCDEIGCGIVPLDPMDRAWREATGRLLCDLAARADRVIRVTGGLPQAIKGEAVWN